MRLSRFLGLTAAASLSLALVACTSEGETTGTTGTTGTAASSATTADGAAFATIEHAYGTTVIPEKPERVATVAWANHEVPLALGVVPVGMAKMTYGDDDGDGIFPWVEDRLEELGAPTPVLFDETDGIDFEAVADTDPDVILAAYSGITQEEYETLSKIAPVVAFPDIPYGTSLDEMIEMDSLAIGKQAEGEKLIDDLHSQSEEALARFPELADKKILFAAIDPADLSTLSVFTLPDTRPGFLRDLGLPQPEIMSDLSADNTTFFVDVSAEEADRLADVDVITVYGDPNGNLLETLQADPLLSKVPAIAEGHLAILPDNTPLAMVANPTPLGLEWGLDDYLALLANAANANQ